MTEKINAGVIGPLSNMQRWFAKYVPDEGPLRFKYIFDSADVSGKRGEALEYWQSHGAELVERGDFDALTRSTCLVTICAGKHLEATQIYPQLVQAMQRNCQGGAFAPTIVDFSTYSPGGADVISRFCRRSDIRFANVPVSGGPGGAEEATMIEMYGGPQEIWDDLHDPLFRHIGKPSNYGPQPAAGAMIKMIGQRMVFSQLEGICGAIAMETMAFRDGKLGGAEQTARFNILNCGAGGGAQWSKALIKGIEKDIWTKDGFLNPHAAADGIYSALFAAALGLSRHKAVNPLLGTAASLGFVMKKYGLDSATQALVRTELAETAEDHDRYLDDIAYLTAASAEEAVVKVTASLPPEVSRIVIPDLTLDHFTTVA